MSARPKPSAVRAALRPARSARDAVDWLTPQDVLEHALAAFYGAATLQRRGVDPRMYAPGESTDGWWSRAAFCEDVAHLFAHRLARLAQQRGVDDGALATDGEGAQCLARLEADIEAVAAGRFRWGDA